jgi:hypothetical protein
MSYERAAASANHHERLIELTRSGDCPSRDLAEELRAWEQTTHRDIDFLKRRRYSTRAKKRSDGWACHLLAEPATVSSGKGASRT